MSQWYDRAEKHLAEEYGEISGLKESGMKAAVRDALLEFSRQDEEFAQAVAQGKGFKACMAAVARGVGSSMSDLEAYRRAAAFYFDGAKVDFTMTIHLTPTEVEPTRDGIVLDLSDFF